MKELELYPAVKALLERQGYEVKSEIGPVDVMARRGTEEPIIVELKTGLTIALLKQAIARQSMFDLVYVAVPRPNRRGRKARSIDIALMRRLALGLIEIRPSDGFAEILCDPGPYHPRKNKSKRALLLREFANRRGDPNQGGQHRSPVITAYRQDALRCAAYLVRHGATKGALVAKEVGVSRATRIMADNHYGWFSRKTRGVYQVTETGRLAGSEPSCD